jgi:uncharacterized iron-regulated membrane protein
MDSRTKRISLVLALVVMAAPLAFDSPLEARQLKERPKVTMKQARATALATSPGSKVTASRLQKDGEKLVYEFGVKTTAGQRDVWVDAMTGKVVKNDAATVAAKPTKTIEASRTPAKAQVQKH